MKDFFGNELEIGDTVAFNPPYYKGLVKGTIVNIMNVQVAIGYKNTWNFPKTDPETLPVKIKNDYPYNVVKYMGENNE